MYDCFIGDLDITDERIDHFWEEEFVAPMRLVYLKVIEQLMEDLNSVNDAIRQEAIEWLMGGSDDMKCICYEVDLNPEWVRNRAREVLSVPLQQRKRRGKVKREFSQMVLEF